MLPRTGSISIALEIDQLPTGDRTRDGRRTCSAARRARKKRGEAETRLENASQSERECFLRESVTVKVLVYKQLVCLLVPENPNDAASSKFDNHTYTKKDRAVGDPEERIATEGPGVSESETFGNSDSGEGSAVFGESILSMEDAAIGIDAPSAFSRKRRINLILIGSFLFALAVAAARASYFGSLEGHGFGSEPKLISQSVHLKEIPTKIIKVTKTAVVKVPVPYPVKVPHHIPVPVPVNHPIAVPYTKLVKVQETVPIEVSKPVPIEIQQQVPVVVPKAVPVPQPIPVPQPVALPKPVFYPVPHPIPYQAHSESDGGAGGYDSGDDHIGHDSESYSSYTVNEQGHGGYDHSGGHGHFQPSQPDYTSHHHHH
ncbi:uncharacterized protein LOC143181381 [Calliopsis andreniformis]|uniref:uncharacterized protein LOC143181381 n=1 Tax=Calliopsis andreniformis TaxID=337506 RepID=UPI003FCC5BE9